MSTQNTKTPEEYLSTIDDCMEDADIEKAEEICKEALAIYPGHLEIVEVVSTICLELGKSEEAKTLLQRAIALCPDSGFAKYMSIGQLSSGADAERYYLKGIELLESEASRNNSEPIARHLSNAYTSLGELYMTDLCDENEAEENCNNCLTKAIRADETNPEGYLAMARLKLVRENIDEAKDLIQKSVDLWLPQHEQKPKKPLGFISDDECPLGHTARISTAQVLIETELYEPALKILNALIEENSQDGYTLYLMGWVHYLQGEKLESKRLMKRALDAYDIDETPDETIREHAGILYDEMADIEDPSEDELLEMLNESECETMEDDS